MDPGELLFILTLNHLKAAPQCTHRQFKDASNSFLACHTLDEGVWITPIIDFLFVKVLKGLFLNEFEAYICNNGGLDASNWVLGTLLTNLGA